MKFDFHNRFVMGPEKLGFSYINVIEGVGTPEE